MAFDLMRGFRRLSLKGPVGNGLDNDEEDVKTLKEELRREALFSPNQRIGMTGIIDRDTVDGITAFQRRQGLKPDGILTPGGETERALNRRRASRTMAANAERVEADARARGETGFSVLRANSEAREKARQERRRRVTDRVTEPAGDGLRDGVRDGQPERPAASRSGANQPGAESSARGGGDDKLAALARMADGHGGASRSEDAGAPGRISAAAAHEALFNLSEADRAELRKLLDLPNDATTEEIRVALGPAIVVIPALFGIGVGASIVAQDKETRDKIAKAASRGLENARDNLSDLADRTQEFFGSDDDAGEPAAKDRPQHPAFQAIDPGTLEPPRGSDPEEARDTPSSPPPQQTTNVPTGDRLINLPADIQAEIEEFPILDPALARFGQIVHAHRGDLWTQRGINIEIRALIEAARPYLEPLKGKLTNFAGGKAEGYEDNDKLKERALKAFDKQRRGFSVPDAGLKADIAASPENLTEEERRIFDFFTQEFLINTGLVRKDGTPVAPERRQKERLDRNIAARRKSTNDVERGIGIFRPKLRPGMDEAAFAQESRAFFKQFLRDKLGPPPGG